MEYADRITYADGKTATPSQDVRNLVEKAIKDFLLKYEKSSEKERYIENFRLFARYMSEHIPFEDISP